MPEMSGAVTAGSTQRKPRVAGASRGALKRTALGLAVASGVAAAAAYGYRYWTVGQYLEATDDAYVKADYTTVASKISGYIVDVPVRDNESVKAGQVIARIDDRDFRTALDQARANVTAAEAAARNLDTRIVLQRSVIAQKKAEIASAEASLQFARQEQARYGDLVKTGYGTVQRAQQSEAALREKVAQLDRGRAGLVAAHKEVDVRVTEHDKAEAELARARANEHQAELNLSYTVLTAPVDGTVGARSLRVGQYVEAGSPLMAVVPLRSVYIVANFKETQLAHVQAGQPVEIAVDGLPDATLTGHVDSLAPASGLEFALLPPDNATGNFTKIVQRIPVKIVLDEAAPSGRLRPGMSVEPAIDTKAGAPANHGQHLLTGLRGHRVEPAGPDQSSNPGG